MHTLGSNRSRRLARLAAIAIGAGLICGAALVVPAMAAVGADKAAPAQPQQPGGDQQTPNGQSTPDSDSNDDEARPRRPNNDDDLHDRIDKLGAENVDDSTHTRERPKATPVTEGDPPKPPDSDPAKGVAVTGGTVHRGTGTIDRGNGDKRVAIFCWVEVDSGASCTDFRWYQWMCVVITSIDLNDGKGPHKPKVRPDAPSIETATGSKMLVGRWSADDFPKKPEGKGPKEPMFKGAANADCAEPDKPPEAGPYVGEYAIPGQPELKDKQTAERERRLVDAPNLAANGAMTVHDLVKLAKKEGTKKVNETSQPPPGKPITIVITLYFRDALYCDKTCLGTFEWHEEQTYKATPTWVPEGGAAPSSDVNVIYERKYIPELQDTPTPVFEAFKPPPC